MILETLFQIVKTFKIPLLYSHINSHDCELQSVSFTHDNHIKQNRILVLKIWKLKFLQATSMWDNELIKLLFLNISKWRKNH